MGRIFPTGTTATPAPAPTTRVPSTAGRVASPTSGGRIFGGGATPTTQTAPPTTAPTTRGGRIFGGGATPAAPTAPAQPASVGQLFTQEDPYAVWDAIKGAIPGFPETEAELKSIQETQKTALTKLKAGQDITPEIQYMQQTPQRLQWQTLKDLAIGVPSFLIGAVATPVLSISDLLGGPKDFGPWQSFQEQKGQLQQKGAGEAVSTGLPIAQEVLAGIGLKGLFKGIVGEKPTAKGAGVEGFKPTEKDKIVNPEETLKTSVEKKAPTTTTPPGERFRIYDAPNQEALAGDLRAEYSGIKNKMSVQGINLAEGLSKMAPEEQGAMWWFREAKGSIPKLLAALKDDKFKPYWEDIRKATNLSDNAKKALEIGDRYYKTTGEYSKNLGTIHNVIENYDNRIYAPRPPKTGAYLEGGRAGLLKEFTRHAKGRVYGDAFEAVKAGEKFQTTDYSKALAVYNEEMARVNTTHLMTTAMHKANIFTWESGDTPEGWSNIPDLTKRVAILDKEGNPQMITYRGTAPTGIAKGLSALYSPNLLTRIEEFRQLGKFQGLVKTVDLAYSAFHHFTLAMQLLYQTKGGIDIIRSLPQMAELWKSGDFPKIEEWAVRNDLITTRVDAIQDVIREINASDDFIARVTKLPGFKAATDLAEANSRILFDGIQRFMKVTDWYNKMAQWSREHANGATEEEVTRAGRSYAKEINAAYGGLNWEQMGISKTQLAVARLALLAPDWTISNAALLKYAAEKGVGGDAARGHLLTAFMGGLLVTEALNKILTGHYTNDNKRGHQFEVEVAPDVYVSFFRGGIGDTLKWIGYMAESGPIGGTFRMLQIKTAPVTRTAMGEVMNIDPMTGRPIRDPSAGFASNTFRDLAFAIKYGGPVPFGVAQELTYLQDQKTDPISTFLIMLGLARYAPTTYSAGQQKIFDIIYQQQKKLGKSDMAASLAASRKASGGVKKPVQEDVITKTLRKAGIYLR